MMRVWKKIGATAASLRRESRAAVLIEMAFAIPFIAFVGCGGLEMANLVLTHTRINQVALNAADNAARIATGSSMSQPIIREIDINEVFTGVARQTEGMDFKENGRIILSSLERNDDDGQWIHWQRCYGDMDVASDYGEQGTGATGTDFAGMGPAGEEVTASDGTAVMFVEVVYQYRPLLYGKWLGPRTIRSTAAFNIREGRDLDGPDDEGVYNPAPAVAVSSCPEPAA